MKVPRSRAARGFTIVEIVLGLTIMSLLVGVTVSTYGDSLSRAREQIARDEARAISQGVQRWQLENKRPYPFESIFPLVPAYLRQVKKDPWGGVFRVDTNQKIVYSFGSNGLDEAGGGDDITHFYDNTGDVAPGPPANLTVRLDNTEVVFDFDSPQRNADGSTPVDDLHFYFVDIRPNDKVEGKTFQSFIRVKDTTNDYQQNPYGYRKENPGAPASSVPGPLVACPDPPYVAGDGSLLSDGASLRVATSVISGLFPEYGTETFDRSYYFTARTVDCAGNVSVPSNQAGLFVAKDVGPRVVTFRASSPTPAVSSAFSFFIEVSDADSNLDSVVLRNWPNEPTWDKDSADPTWKISNQFRFLRNWAPPAVDLASTATFNNVFLDVVDEKGNTIQSAPLSITVTNSKPVVTALNPGIQLLTVNPAATADVHIDFTFEASDREGNLEELRFRYIDLGPPYTILQEDLFELDPPGSIMVRTTGVDFDITAPHDFVIEVVATDALGSVSSSRVASVKVANDSTPPDALQLSLDPSNQLLATQPFFFWYINTPDDLPVHVEAFEIESPPIRYEVKVSTAPLQIDGGVPPNDFDNAPYLTQSINSFTPTSHDGWYEFPEASLDVNGDFTLTVGAGLQASMQEDELYYVGMRATNSSDLTNLNTATPVHQASFNRQYPIRLDISPPIVTVVDIEGKVSGVTTWITDLLDANWEVVDPIGGTVGNPPGSGPHRYRYRIRREKLDPPPSGPRVFVDVFRDFTEISSLELNSLQLPNDTTDNGHFILLDILAQDRAGNWSPDPTTAEARVDFTPPLPAAPPVIRNQVDGVISVTDTFEAGWGPAAGAADFAFRDLESGIESWQWGISTTDIVGSFPDIFGWQAVLATVTSASISQNDLLVNGDRVHAVVRGVNGAGSVSAVGASTAALVDASLFTSLVGTPSSGLSPLSVSFTATVTGGTPPYDMRFQFDGTPDIEFRNPAFDPIAQGTQSLTTDFTYDFSVDPDLPRPEIICRLIVRDQDGRQSQKDFIVDVREDAMLAMAFQEDPGVVIGKLTGSTYTPLFVVSHENANTVGAGIPPTQDLIVHPRGSWMATVPTTSRFIYFAGIDDISGAEGRVPVPLQEDAGESHPYSADHTAVSFRQSGSEGEIVQVFQDLDGSAGNGYLRRFIFDANGATTSRITFGGDPVTNRDFRAAAPNGGLFSQGVAVMKESCCSQEVTARRILSLDLASPQMEFFDPFEPPEEVVLAQDDPGDPSAPPNNTSATISRFGTRMVGTRVGPYLMTVAKNSEPAKGIVKIETSGGAMQSAQTIPFPGPSPAAPTGYMDATGDGRGYVFVVGSSDGPNQSQWALSAGLTLESTFADHFGFPNGFTSFSDAPGTIRGLDVDDGGSTIAITYNNGPQGRVRIGTACFGGCDPGCGTPCLTYEPVGGVVRDFVAPDIGNGPGRRLAAARIFRRPNNGFAKLDAAIRAISNNIADPVPDIESSDADLLIRGTNLDLVDEVEFRFPAGAGGTVYDCGGNCLQAGGPVPPANPFNGLASPPLANPNGDLFHFRRVTIPAALIAALPSGTQDVEIRARTTVGTGGVVASVNKTFNKP